MPSKLQRTLRTAAEHIEQAANALQRIEDERPELRETRLRWLADAQQLARTWGEEGQG